MSLPGFTAEASVGPTTGRYRGEADFGRSAWGAGRSTVVTQALKGSGAIQTRRTAEAVSAILGGGTLGFSCGQNSCRCNGIDDCIDLLVNTNLCGDYIDCTYRGVNSTCYCVRPSAPTN